MIPSLTRATPIAVLALIIMMMMMMMLTRANRTADEMTDLTDEIYMQSRTDLQMPEMTIIQFMIHSGATATTTTST
jgi:hypothetical protein